MIFPYALDFDGVLNNFLQQFIETAKEVTGKSLVGHPDSWYMLDWAMSQGVTKSDFFLCMRLAIKGLNRKGMGRSHSDVVVDVIKYMSDGYTFAIITDRKDIAEVNTWLSKRVGRRFWFVVSSYGRQKSDVMRAIPGIVGLIDDKPEHVVDADANGYVGLLLSRPYNMESGLSTIGGLRSVLVSKCLEP
jgi:hypothetical protein